MNEFLNSLTDDEFTEFVQARDIPVEKLQDTGRGSELPQINLHQEQSIDLREQLMIETALKDRMDQERKELEVE